MKSKKLPGMEQKVRYTQSRESMMKRRREIEEGKEKNRELEKQKE